MFGFRLCIFTYSFRIMSLRYVPFMLQVKSVYHLDYVILMKKKLIKKELHIAQKILFV